MIPWQTADNIESSITSWGHRDKSPFYQLWEPDPFNLLGYDVPINIRWIRCQVGWSRNVMRVMTSRSDWEISCRTRSFGDYHNTQYHFGKYVTLKTNYISHQSLPPPGQVTGVKLKYASIDAIKALQANWFDCRGTLWNLCHCIITDSK